MSKRPIYIVFTGFFAAILIMLGWSILQGYRAVEAQQKLIQELRADNVKYLTLYPNYDPNSLIDDSVNIHDQQIIAQVVNAYKHMRPERAGDGKLRGRWQITVTFITHDRRQITSDIYHNDYADLVFIPTPVLREMKNPGDMLASNEISQVLLNALSRK